MTIPEAIKIIDEKTVPKNDGFFYEVAEAKQIVKDAFYERQTPQKPCMSAELYYACPNCHTRIKHNAPYCFICGQALDWGIEVDDD